MKIRKVILSVLIAMFLVSLVPCGQNCIIYEKSAKSTASAEGYYEQLQQREFERISNDWNYAMNLSAGYVEQRRESQAMIDRAQEKVWEQEDIQKELSANAFRSAGITIILFIITCIFGLKAMQKKNTIH